MIIIDIGDREGLKKFKSWNQYYCRAVMLANIIPSKFSDILRNQTVFNSTADALLRVSRRS